MKLKVVVVDLDVSTQTKRRLLELGVTLGVLLGGGAIAWASMLHTWNTGDTLQASDLNGNFSNLQGQITSLQGSLSATQGQVTTLQSSRSVVWKDATGAVIPVVLGEVSGSPGALAVADASGNVWSISAATGLPLGGSTLEVYYSGANCTGTEYVQMTVGRSAFGVGGASEYVIPDTATASSISTASHIVTGFTTCTTSSATLNLIPLSATLQVSPPSSPLFVPPIHPEFDAQ